MLRTFSRLFGGRRLRHGNSHPAPADQRYVASTQASRAIADGLNQIYGTVPRERIPDDLAVLVAQLDSRRPPAGSNHRSRK